MPDFSIDPKIAKAKTLHTDFYNSPEIFEQCKENIFANSWQFIRLIKYFNMKNLLVLFFTTIFINTYAQKFEWAKGMGASTSFDNGHVIVVDDSGNVYTMGWFAGTADFDPDTGTYYYLNSAGGNDLFISKLDASGKFVWAKSIGNSGDDAGWGLTYDGEGNIYITGHFENKVDFNPGAGVYNLSSNGSNDIFILKLDVSGNFIWAKKVGGTDSDVGLSIALDATYNIYVTGVFTGSVDFDPGKGKDTLHGNGGWDIFVLKLDSSGNYQWAKSVGGNDYDYGAFVNVDGAGNVYVTGYFSTAVDFDPGAATYKVNSNGNWDIFILKLDSLGKFIWAQGIGGSDPDFGHAIDFDPVGNVYFTGNYAGTVDFDASGGTANVTAAGVAHDAFVLKLDSSGNFLWVKSIGGSESDMGFDIHIDAFGYIYTIGRFINTADFDPGTATYNLTSVGNNGNPDAFVLKLDSSGDFVWAINMGGSGWDQGYGLALGCSGNIYTTGYFSQTADFDPDTGTYNLTSSGKDDIFVSKLNDCDIITTQPNTQMQYVGGNAQFIIASSSKATKFQWQIKSGNGFVDIVSGGQYSGVNDDTLNIDSVMLSQNNYIYRCIVKDSNCSSISCKALLKVKCNLSITTQPFNQYINAGANAQYILASSNSNCTFQWQENHGSGFINLVNGGQYSGVNNDTLYINNVTFMQNSNSYRCFINDGSCSDTSGVAKLYVNCILNITTQPTNQTVNIGSNAKYIIAASSKNAVYQWQEDIGSGFTNLYNIGQYSGVDNDTFSIGNVLLSQNNYNYRCIISEGGCADTSNTVSLTANCVLKIINQPSSQALNVGDNAQYYIAASSQTAAYQWQEDVGSGFMNVYNSGQYSGANNDTLAISNILRSQNNYSYRCIISETGCADTSVSVLLNVSCVLKITTQPTDKTLNAGAAAQYNIIASNQVAAYQWQENKGTGFINLTNTGQYSGVTTGTLKIANVSFFQNNYSYHCIINDAGCSDTSNVAVLKVNCTLMASLQPKDQTVNVNTNAQFKTYASSLTANFQWQEDTGNGFVNLTNVGKYIGVYTNTITITNISLSQNNYKYRCVISETGCFDTTSSALLKVNNKMLVSNANYSQNINIYPNPSQGVFTITHSTVKKEIFIIYNTLGEYMYHDVWNNETSKTIDLSHLAKGIYYIKIGDEAKKIIIE